VRATDARRWRWRVLLAALVVAAVDLGILVNPSTGPGRVTVKPVAVQGPAGLPQQAPLPKVTCTVGPGAVVGTPVVVPASKDWPEGQFYAFTNTGPRACGLEDAPRLQMLDAADMPLRTVTDIDHGGAGWSAGPTPLIMEPGRTQYLLLLELDRAHISGVNSLLVCPTSASLQMTFRGSGTITMTGAAGRWAPYQQLTRTGFACGAIIVAPLAPFAARALPG
jgi:hypothetical protein